MRIQALLTPGHSGGSTCFLVEGTGRRDLFSGDTVFWGGLIQLLNLPGSELSSYRESIHRLAGLSVDGLFPGHYLWTLRHGQAHLDQAIDYFKRSAPPPMPPPIPVPRIR